MVGGNFTEDFMGKAIRARVFHLRILGDHGIEDDSKFFGPNILCRREVIRIMHPCLFSQFMYIKSD